MYTAALLAVLIVPSWATDAAADFSPPRDGLLFWLDAADSATLGIQEDGVACWMSKAGVVPVAVSASGRQRPRMRARDEVRAAVVFDGINDVLRSETLTRQMDAWTLVAVVAPAAPIAGGGICSANPHTSHDYDPGFTVDLFGSTTVFNQLSVEGAGRTGGQLDQMQSEFPAGGLHLVVVVRDREQVRLYVDGKFEGQRPVTPAPTMFDELRIGARHFAGLERQYFHGEIASVLFYERSLADDERQAIEAGLCVSEPEHRPASSRAASGGTATEGTDEITASRPILAVSGSVPQRATATPGRGTAPRSHGYPRSHCSLHDAPQQPVRQRPRRRAVFLRQ